jgi:hypothetical protein
LIAGKTRSIVRAAIMEQPIVGFHQDAERHWVAELACGHFRHVRHTPPWTNRPWVTSARGRSRALGRLLDCKKCDAGAPPDHVT